MALAYPLAPHTRRHGPRGYVEYRGYKAWLRDEFQFQCVYCLIREGGNRGGHRAFGVEHAIPKSVAIDLTCSYDNLLYVCNECNSLRGARSGVLNPCTTAYGEHMSIQQDGRVEGLTPAGWVQIAVLQLNDPRYVEYRQRFILLVQKLGSSNCDATTRELLLPFVAYPPDLPDLRILQPPLGNERPQGIASSYLVLQEAGLLAETY